jgi:hypothetical protein
MGVRPVLLIAVAVFNGIPICLSLLFTGLWFAGNRCTDRNQADLLDGHLYQAYGCTFCAIFLLNILFGVYFYRQISTRSRSLSVMQRLFKLFKSPMGIVYSVLLVFELLFAIVVVSIFPRDTFCLTRESALVNLGVAIAYMIIIAVLVFLVGLVVNLAFECGRPFEDETDDAVDEKPQKKKSSSSSPSSSSPPPTNPFADEPVASAPDVEDEAPPPPAKKSSKKTAEEVADEEWNNRVRAEKGE